MQLVKRFLLLLFFCFAIASTTCAQSRLMAVLEMRGLERVAEDLETLSEALATGIDSEDTLAHIGRALQNPELEGLDAEGVFRFYVVYPEMFNIMVPPIVTTAPLTDDGSKALKALSASLSRGKEEDGLLAFKADIPSASLPGGVLYAGIVEQRLVLGANRELVRAIMQDMRLGHIDPKKNLEGSGSFAVSLRVTELVAALEPLISMQMQMMTAMAATTNAPAPGQPDVAGLLEAEYDFFLSVLRQLEQVSLTLDLSDDELSVYSRVTPVTGSLLASLVADAKQPAALYRSAIPENAYYAHALYWPNPDAFIEPYGEFIKKVYASMGMQDTGINDLLDKLLAGVTGQFRGDLAFGLLPGEGEAGVDFVEVIHVNDPEALEELMEGVVALQAMMGQQDLGYTYALTNLPVRTYREVQVKAYAASMELSDAVKNRQPAAVQDWYRNLRHESAHIGNHLIYVMGSEEAMNTMIDRILDEAGAPLDEREPFRQDFPELEQAPSDLFMLSLARISELVPQQGAASVQAAEDEETAEFEDGVLSGCSFSKGRSYVSVSRVHLQDLVTLKNSLLTITGMMGKMNPVSGVSAPAP